MRLITGPLRSGKTTAILDRFRAELRSGARQPLLFVPTATMAEHLRNRLLREKFVFPPSAVTTLSKFAGEFAAGTTAVSTAALQILLDEVLRDQTVYTAVSDFAGFRSALVHAIEEVSAAGGSPSSLEGLGVDEFTTVYQAVATEVVKRKWLFKSEQLRESAAAIGARTPSKSPVFIDGFFSFTPAELAIIKALAAASPDLIVTLPEWPAGERAIEALIHMGAEVEWVAPQGRSPERILIDAPTFELEVTDIARRILDEHASGRHLREIGVIVRSEALYVDALRAAFERFGIPCRFYFGADLTHHSAIRYLTGLVQLVLTNWEHASAATVLRLPDSPLEAAGFGDSFEASLRKGTWTSGLEEIAGAMPEGYAFAESLQSLDSLRTQSLTPAKWVQKLLRLQSLLASPEIRDRISHERAALWRERGQALAAFETSLNEAAELCDANANLSLAGFWEVVRTVIAERTLRVNDHRRDVVHIIDAFEARQWELPVVFVCGLLEGDFPKHHTQDPLLPDYVRKLVQDRGIQLQASTDRQQEEAFLFDVATSRATSKLFLSYPKLNAKGDANLRSFLLDKFCERHNLKGTGARGIRPHPKLQRRPLPPPAIRDEALQVALRQSTAVLRPTAIEVYLQCPFQYFAEHTLKLKALAEVPSQRMNGPAQGSVVHAIMERVARDKMDVAAALDQVFEKSRLDAKIPQTYRLEAIRLEILYYLRRFLNAGKLQAANQLLIERDIEFQLDEHTIVRGRVDRIEVDAHGRATVIDLKYKDPKGVKDLVKAHNEGRLVQGGLYLAALQGSEWTPTGMLYCATKKDAGLSGWIAEGAYAGLGHDCSPQDLNAMIAASREVAANALVQIRAGHIAPEPFDEDKCQYCNSLHLCRYEAGQAAVVAGGAQ